MMLQLFRKFKEGFLKTQKGLWSGLAGLFSKKLITAEDWEQFEATLYGADFGPEAVEKILQRMQKLAKEDKEKNGAEILRQVLSEMLSGSEGHLEPASELQVILMLGVNGAGKTTTVAKLAHQLQTNGDKVLLGSCDTFRAAADQQLKTWAERLQLDCVGSHQGADAAAVAFDACQAGMHRGCRWLLLDTAGRLHNKVGLLEELKKMLRVMKKCDERFPQHRWLIVDGSLGTNSIMQAKLFHEAVGLTGLIVTKLDGTSKGGALVGIYDALKVPIYYVGLGEKPEDLRPFSTEAYIDAVIGEHNEGDK